mmetsp:Transcript_29154/g.44079  ORF Transcript_29154/g.44079 Transcript_29154/m.44079 type:complete len:445 (+) Transcript_29154:162-1496(+)
MAEKHADAGCQTLLPVGESGVIDNPCWGSKCDCSLLYLIGLIDRSTTIILESEEYIVLNKPPDLRMDGDYPATVIKLLTYWYPPDSLQSPSANLMQKVSYLTKLSDLYDNEIRPCHQLDYATSGALLVGRTRRAAGIACEAFRNRTIDKIYLALVHGHVEIDCPTISGVTKEDIVNSIRSVDKRRASKSKANRKKSFQGFQPASSIFLKWKIFYSRKGGKRPRDFDMMCNVERKVSLKEDLDSMASMSWGQIKTNKDWKSVFDDVAKTYNDSLKDEQKKTENVEPAKNLDLPAVFRLKADNDENIFYVNASLASKVDDFAMEIHADALKNEDVKMNQECSALDFKVAVTRCTIMGRGMLQCGTKTTKMKLQPLTGRRHQLRCHMKVADAPIIGDATYSNGKQVRGQVVTRMCLHALSLKLPNNIDVETPDPFVMEGHEVHVKIV